MTIFKRIDDLRNHLDEQKVKHFSIGFVPTMGALHDGHLTLIRTCNEHSDITVCSIFINPTQFNDPKDFDKYPVTLEKDIQLLVENNCDILFLPSVAEMYPSGLTEAENFNLGSLETKLEGFYRPGHFQGVCQIVNKLLNAVAPDLLFMGQKDLQQCMVIKHLLKEKAHKAALQMVSTVREADGLAMSSRNVRLSPSARKQATVLYKVLKNITNRISNTAFDTLIEEGKKEILRNGFNSIDYLEICIPEALEKATIYTPQQPYAVLVAAFIEDVRLIDNMLVSETV